MKKTGLLILFLLALAFCGLSRTAVDVTQAQSVIEAARAAQDAAQAAKVASQGLSDVGRGLTLILVLLTLALITLIGLTVYLVTSRMAWRQKHSAADDPGLWLNGPNADWKRLGQPDGYQQMLLQQWLLAQLLSQGHAAPPVQSAPEAEEPPQLPTGWWG